MNVEEKVNHLFPDIQKWRRHLHQNPELSYHEIRTAAFIAETLEAMGLKVKCNVGGHGVVAELQGGLSGPTVAFRADIDALAIQDEKRCDYASSIPGVMHACGHDAHTATLLGVASALTECRNELKGNVRFIFQPAEEISPGGALPMIAEGVLEGVSAIYGVHVWSQIPAGRIALRSGVMWAAVDEFLIRIKGKGGHCGVPHETVDSVLIGSHLVVNLQAIVSRIINPVMPCVLSVGSIHAGTGFNVIADECTLNGTVRSFDPVVRDEIAVKIKHIAEQTSLMFGASCEIEYKFGYPPLVNDARESERFFQVAREAFGEQAVFETSLMMPGDDFAYYLQKVPGCYMLVGAGNSDLTITAPHHNPKFDIDESAMQHAAKLLLSMCLNYFETASLDN